MNDKIEEVKAIISKGLNSPGRLNNPVYLAEVILSLSNDPDVTVNSVINVNTMIKTIEFSVENTIVFRVDLPFVTQKSALEIGGKQ